MPWEPLSDIDDFYPTDCVLCGHSADTPEEHEQHMAEVHGL